MLLFLDEEGTLVAIGAHEMLSQTSAVPPGTFIRFVAIAAHAQRATVPTAPPEANGHMCRLSTYVFRAIIADAHACERGSEFFLLVDPDNRVSLGLCERMGFTLDPNDSGPELALIASIMPGFLPA